MRHASPTDRRLRLLTLTPEGDTLPVEVQPGMLRAQARRLEPLPPEQRGQFMEMLKVGNNEYSRAPSVALAPAVGAQSSAAFSGR